MNPEKDITEVCQVVDVCVTCREILVVEEQEHISDLLDGGASFIAKDRRGLPL